MGNLRSPFISRAAGRPPVERAFTDYHREQNFLEKSLSKGGYRLDPVSGHNGALTTSLSSSRQWAV